MNRKTLIPVVIVLVLGIVAFSGIGLAQPAETNTYTVNHNGQDLDIENDTMAWLDGTKLYVSDISSGYSGVEYDISIASGDDAHSQLEVYDGGDRLLYWSGSTEEASIYNISDLTNIQELDRLAYSTSWGIDHVEVVNNGDYLVSLDVDNYYLFDLKGDTITHQQTTPTDRGTGGFVSNGTHVWHFSDQFVKLFKIENDQLVLKKENTDTAGGKQFVEFSPNGEKILTGSSREILEFNPETLEATSGPLYQYNIFGDGDYITNTESATIDTDDGHLEYRTPVNQDGILYNDSIPYQVERQRPGVVWTLKGSNTLSLISYSGDVSITGPNKIVLNHTAQYNVTHDGTDVTETAHWSTNDPENATIENGKLNLTERHDSGDPLQVKVDYYGMTNTTLVQGKRGYMQIDGSFTPKTNVSLGKDLETPLWVNESAFVQLYWGDTYVKDPPLTGEEEVSGGGIYTWPENGTHFAVQDLYNAHTNAQIFVENPSINPDWPDQDREYTMYKDYNRTLEINVTGGKTITTEDFFGDIVTSDPSVIDVYMAKNLIGNSTGTATVTAQLQDPETFRLMGETSQSLDVVSAGISLTVEDSTITRPTDYQNTPERYNYTVTKTNATGTHTITETANVTSGNVDIVQVSDVLNQYYPMGFGTATLTAESGGQTDTANVTVETEVKWGDYSGLETGQIPILVFSDWTIVTIFALLIIAAIVGLAGGGTLITHGVFMFGVIGAWLIGYFPDYLMWVALISSGIILFVYQSMNVTVFKGDLG